MKAIVLAGILFALSIIAPYAHADSVSCYCVLALRELQGIDIRGDAWTQRPNVETQYVRPGDVLLMRYPKSDHVALVLDVTEPTRDHLYVSIVEYNYHHCQKSYRTLSLDDESIRGVLRPTQYPQVA